MKAKVSSDLLGRIKCAKENGSIIATELLEAIKASRDMSEETDKTVNYFDSKRIVNNYDARKAIRVVVTCCRKDVTNPRFPDYGNPQAPYFPENRDSVSLKDFACYFKNIREKDAAGAYTDADWQYFDGAARIGQKVTLRIGTTMSDFIKAYDSSNYIGLCQSDQSTLHGSCMRYEEQSRNAADFYNNFAGAKILIAEAADGSVCGRALVWEDIEVLGAKEHISYLDRVYTAFDSFILPMMYSFAKEHGITMRKKYNDYSHKTQWLFMSDCELHYADNPEQTFLTYSAGDTADLTIAKKVPSIKLHKQGAPYVDTLSYLYYKDGEFHLANSNGAGGIGRVVATLTSTYGYGEYARYICPSCGKTHGNRGFCGDCADGRFKDTPFGSIMVGKTKQYKKTIVPADLMDGNKPKKFFQAFITLERICNSSNNL